MDERGYYGEFGGAYIPEILVATFDELSAAFTQVKADASFCYLPCPLSSSPLATSHWLSPPPSGKRSGKQRVFNQPSQSG